MQVLQYQTRVELDGSEWLYAAREGIGNNYKISPQTIAEFVVKTGYFGSQTQVAQAAAVAAAQSALNAATQATEATAQADRAEDAANSVVGLSSDPNSGYIGTINVSSSIVCIADSNGESQGASSYPLGFLPMFARSLINSRDNGVFNDVGYGWHSDVNQTKAVYNGYSSTGTIVAGGLTDRRSLAAGQSITITQRAFNVLYAIYDGALSTGSLAIAKNGGSPISTQAVSGASLNATTAVTVDATESDVVTITAVGGTVVVTASQTIKTAAGGSFIYASAKAGTAFQDYTSAAALDEIAYYLNFQRTTAQKVMLWNLGTNNAYNPGKATTPSAMVALMQALVTGVNSRATNVRHVFEVFPKANESLWPIQSPGFVYEDYASAMVAFCLTGGHGVVRNDLSEMSRFVAPSGDGLHHPDIYHRIRAENNCKAFDVPLQPYTRTSVPPYQTFQGLMKQAELDLVLPINAPWRPLTNNAAFTAQYHLNGGLLALSGVLEPNGSASTTIGTLPVGYRPLIHTRRVIVMSDGGAIYLSISPSGGITVSAIPAAWVSLDGVMIPLART